MHPKASLRLAFFFLFISTIAAAACRASPIAARRASVAVLALPSSYRNSDSCRGKTRSFLRGIDVNRLPSAVDMKEEARVSSPNNTVSSVSGKRSEREPNSKEHDMNSACSRGINDEEDRETSRKKLRLSKDQSVILEESFKEHNTLNH
ncbi:homeobox-leucine zipper protein HAT4-like, partial [Vigna umbellata]|uniref:homeobox-leucine zipper protein HAT4-like n=1 Tax=Vigna umbellata TaxID=87088 RepID=UPI001F5F0406